MKLLRYGPKGREKPAVLDRDGAVRDLSSLAGDITPKTLAAGLIEAVKVADLSKLPILPAGQRIGPCVAESGNFIAVGLNYADHAAETGAEIPKEPILFNKARSCIIGPNDDVQIPPGSEKSDWEVEIAFVIGKTASHVPEADALSYVAGYCICNDVSERAYQIERGGQWMKGKCCPTFGPLGPYLVTTDEVPDPQNLSLWLELNGKKVQDGSTRTMIFPIAHLVSYISQFMILEPGDIVTTGTPPGVGLGMKPPLFLKKGDVMRLGIDGLGVQQQHVI
ncbi:fumarylacetoacetate hydrolase family protein [Bosea sp. PAMC 26642]|uniref:fumarylacetoacetate hydrolase family protein n=1 Tax=Bosea sp. (strain PAMC 26642) TaxID=1792307 RepID=UPI0007705619|nr:fumarylacetoacetate hydrolase family protein [Bosea sp. PAMC 26642]AMJ63722.1 2-hydroxyhepta-2,4-diene-1,7-dioate isomerase [Bosea sp. PAMC 26642]